MQLLTTFKFTPGRNEEKEGSQGLTAFPLFLPIDFQGGLIESRIH